MEKIRENNQKSKNLIELYAKHSLGLKHDKIWPWWALGMVWESMLERVWWYRHLKMKF